MRMRTITVLATVTVLGLLLTLARAQTQEAGQSAQELSKQLSNPVTNLWSLNFQFNNYILDNGHWNHNLLFQPVLPISLTENSYAEPSKV
jgi:hypothetical protein